MHLITGLGNPGQKYQATRHNVGELVIKQLLAAYNLRLAANKRLQSSVVKTSAMAGSAVILALPATFMNNSGLAVHALAAYYKIKPESLIIIHDDIDLPFGKIRLKKDGSSGGHNGLKSIIENLGTKKFIRLKIGVGPKPEKLPSEKYVLRKFSKSELKQLQETVIPEAINALLEILKNGMETAMNKYN